MNMGTGPSTLKILLILLICLALIYYGREWLADNAPELDLPIIGGFL
jgi:hypothetical protein